MTKDLTKEDVQKLFDGFLNNRCKFMKTPKTPYDLSWYFTDVDKMNSPKLDKKDTATLDFFMAAPKMAKLILENNKLDIDLEFIKSALKSGLLCAELQIKYGGAVATELSEVELPQIKRAIFYIEQLIEKTK